MVPEETGRCKMCGATDGKFFHNFWECGKIRWFWDKLMNYINSTFSFRLVKHPLPCLLLNFSDWDLYYERQKAFPDIEKGVEKFYKKWEAYISSLPNETQVQLSRVFESTSWYLLLQIV